MSNHYDFMKGRPDDILWLMFRGASFVNHSPHGDCYRYLDGKNPVLFVLTERNTVHVSQPGVCLFEKIFVTNNTKTKWEQI